MAANKEKPIQHMVIDTCAIIANRGLHTLADQYYAPPQILDELRSSEARRIWGTLPFEVILREPTQNALRAVIDASKTTGDFQSLSMVDIKMIALTYDLHRQFVAEKEIATTTEEEEKKIIEDLSEKVEKIEIDNEKTEEEQKAVEKKVESDDSAIEEVEGSEASENENTETESDADDDESGWITQDNIEETLKKLGAFEIEENMVLGCLTTDFALQNVLLAMNLSLVSLSGYRIRKLKSFVLRCRTCFTTTSVMTKEFCPSCGHKTLHKCAVSVDEDGKQQLHINWNRMSNRRGLVYTLANPKGGKHAINERLFEDQPMPHMRMAKVHLDPLADGPFSVHDVNSRSAMLGVRTINNRAKQSRNRNEAKRGGRRK
ncbi:hypothetical protein GCK72_000911 [Caenorhabditis remanei]|uniref:RNA-binding protein NOB1 n=1 Tax=Caenorhabditis remanei TaxID=31234 RepID=A0A6A5HMG5_CAERE|nr:hypothetical protein GCK72_000911 [Caenorhabditis remanei]KAF1769098.1 hypothetical protein GCK72_000911 [Caenorhabditis remanei]